MKEYKIKGTDLIFVTDFDMEDFSVMAPKYAVSAKRKKDNFKNTVVKKDK